MIKRALMSIAVAAGLALATMSVASAADMVAPKTQVTTAPSMFYGGALIGGVFTHDTEAEFAGTTYDVTVDPGIRFGAFVGVKLTDAIRAEIEATRAATDTATTVSTSETTATTLMLNVLYDVHAIQVPIGPFALTPYVGAGVGLAFVDTDAVIGGLAFSGDDMAFAQQVLAGVTVPLTDRLAFRGGYRLQHINETGDKGVTVDGTWSHGVEAALIFHF